MNPEGAQHRAENRPGAGVPVLLVFNGAHPHLKIRGSIVLDFHLAYEGIELALDPSDGALDFGEVGHGV